MARLDMSGLEAPPLLPGEPATAPLTAFEEDPNQPRTQKIEGEDFDNLVEDIRQRGILQPIVVVKSPTGKLRILFGARRYRAAKQLEFSLVPYVLSTDSRQWDDYSQVSENEHRKNLEPMELAEFIAKRLKQGDSHTEIAKGLRKSKTAITFLHSLFDAPPFVKQLYETGKCRSPLFLYRLTKLWEKNAAVIEARVMATQEITTRFLDALTAEIDPKPGAQALGPLAEEQAATMDVMPPTPQLEPAADLSAVSPLPSKVPAKLDPVVDKATQPHDSASKAKGQPERLKKPVVYARHGIRDVTVLIFRAPTTSGSVHVRYEDDGHEAEVPCAGISLTGIAEAAG